MFKIMLKFFLNNARVNYTLLILIFLAGIYSFNKIPKEIFPIFELDTITVSGGYAGASINMLDKMAVGAIEDSIINLNGVEEISTKLIAGSFSLYVEVSAGFNKYDLVQRIKDNINQISINFPSDMNMPIVKIVQIKSDLLEVDIASDILNNEQLIDKAKELQILLSKQRNVSDVLIYGNSSRYLNILIDEKKVMALGLNPINIYNEIGKLSYIFPIGKIEDPKKHIFISTMNANYNLETLENIKLNINNKIIFLKDIAIVMKRYKAPTTYATLNTKNSISLAVSKNEIGNSLLMSKDIRHFLNEIKNEYKDITLNIHKDRSVAVKERLNIVGSNIFLSILLVSSLMALLINARIASVVALGIPTSFIMATIFFHQAGYTINLISLIGVLVAIGIVVDDAIVVSENIQYHIEKGLKPKEAAYIGTLEMIEPVTIASLTTLFSFIPILMISGTLGEFIKLIPIAISSLVLASLIESFIFLPIHSAHLLNKKKKPLNWDRINALYTSLLAFLINYKKTFLFLFIILVPYLSVLGIVKAKFQMFPIFDASDLAISIKAHNNTDLEQMRKIVTQIEKKLFKQKEHFAIDTISSITGFRVDSEHKTILSPNMGYVTIEFYQIKPSNFIDYYITPYLSFDYSDAKKKRIRPSKDIAKEIKILLAPLKQENNLEELIVIERKAGPIKTDVKIGLSGKNTNQTMIALDNLQKELKQINGIKMVSSNAYLGTPEIKLSINLYGQSLGITEQYLGATLSNLFLLKKKANAFDKNDIIDLSIESLNKDQLKTLYTYELPLKNNSFVLLSDVVSFKTFHNYERVSKENGVTEFSVFANVDPNIITASEVLELIQSSLKQLEKDGFIVALKGEKKRNDELKNDMKAASLLALVLILLSLLYLFNSYRLTFILLSIIPFSILGVLGGHILMNQNLSMPSVIGTLGLAGVVLNDGIIMLTFLQKVKTMQEFYDQASKRFRPIILTSVTTIIGLSTLIFFATGQAVILQPIAIALGFGLAWGTVLNLLYLPALYALVYKKNLHC
jgi:multidrug efflux pump subunit AcrB